MKPIAVIQHTEVGAAGALLPILHALGREVQLFRLFRDEPIPQHAGDFAGVVLLGGAMELELVRAADRAGIPVAGHCLGSQMLAFALGGSVERHSRPEIGWSEIRAADDELAREWWGDFAGLEISTFQWHQDTFVPPRGAVQIASGTFCENQAFVLHDRHLLVQSHLEITPELVQATLAKNRAQLLRQLDDGNPAAQAPEAMLEDLPRRTRTIHQVLSRLYSRWIRACRD
jgi:GMP synthase-like glutamine amidotransferase